MASQFEKAAKVQTILFLWLFSAPIFAALLFAATRAADASTSYFWLGLAGMIAGYALLIRSKWDQIQGGDFFTWGLSPSAARMKPVYLASYMFMAAGFILSGVSGLI